MFDFVDLFAGIGGFHASLASLGGRGVQAAEIEPNAAKVYERNWKLKPDGDVRLLAADPETRVKDHAVLAGGFPCQPFSKSGRQLGIAEERGTLFQDIVTILEVKRPPVVVLENVRNIAGPRQKMAWEAVIAGLRGAGYRVSDIPCVFSPHLLSPEAGGAPQVRERVYILGVFVGRDRARMETDVPVTVNNRAQGDWDPELWSIAEHALLPELRGQARQRHALTSDEEAWIDTWNELLARLRPGVKLPGFPMWEFYWHPRLPTLSGMPAWKQAYVRHNHEFYLDNRRAIDAWRMAHPEIRKFPLSRRKLEWQAQDAKHDLWNLLVQLRPSGIRVKRPTYAPALVAMNQTSIYGPLRRRLTPLETAGLQGFDSSFSFGDQVDALSYKQMGNAVNVGAATYVFRKFVADNAGDIVALGPQGKSLVEAVSQASIPRFKSGRQPA